MKKNKLYNMIFPVYPMFISMFFPPLIFLILGGNFIIDSLLMLIISKICFKKISGMFYVKHIFAVWGLGFAADIIGAVVCFSMLFSGIVLETSVIIGFLIAVLFICNYSEQQKIVYLHKRNFEISNSRHADEKSTNWSHAMLSRGTKNAS